MSTYELTVIMPGKATTAKIKSFKDKLDKILKLGKGSVKKFEEWGKIEMAYKLKGDNEGVYLYFDLELDPATVKNINDKLKVENDIMRYLLVKNE